MASFSDLVRPFILKDPNQARADRPRPEPMDRWFFSSESKRLRSPVRFSYDRSLGVMSWRPDRRAATEDVEGHGGNLIDQLPDSTLQQFGR